MPARIVATAARRRRVIGWPSTMRVSSSEYAGSICMQSAVSIADVRFAPSKNRKNATPVPRRPITASRGAVFGSRSRRISPFAATTASAANAAKKVAKTAAASPVSAVVVSFANPGTKAPLNAQSRAKVIPARSERRLEAAAGLTARSLRNAAT